MNFRPLEANTTAWLTLTGDLCSPVHVKSNGGKHGHIGGPDTVNLREKTIKTIFLIEIYDQNAEKHLLIVRFKRNV